MSNPAFPRTIWSFEAEAPRMQGGAVSRGPAGGIQTRDMLNIGRVWRETWLSFNAKTANGRALLEFVNRAWNRGLVFDIVHPFYQTPNGAVTGTPQIDGANQKGETINVKGLALSLAGAWLEGDIIRIAGLGPVFDIQATVNADGAGKAAIKVSPIVLVGNSPADSANITVTGVTFQAVILEEPMLPTVDPSGLTATPMSILFGEAP